MKDPEKIANDLIDEILASRASEKLLITKSEAAELALICVKKFQRSIHNTFNRDMNLWLEVERELKK